ncbi:uncharacterized protein TNCV_4775391 [Trichonephila clavipes]|nr:uncharacterized protein TNCV_4775391 [Trichonephila clavipes]
MDNRIQLVRSTKAAYDSIHYWGSPVEGEHRKGPIPRNVCTNTKIWLTSKIKTKLSNLGGEIFPVSIGLTWEHYILVLKPSPCLHNVKEVDDWMGLNEWNSWFKSSVRDSNRSRDIVNLSKKKSLKQLKPVEEIAL